MVREAEALERLADEAVTILDDEGLGEIEQVGVDVYKRQRRGGRK